MLFYKRENVIYFFLHLVASPVNKRQILCVLALECVQILEFYIADFPTYFHEI
jgi:hypothetical protein